MAGASKASAPKGVRPAPSGVPPPPVQHDVHQEQQAVPVIPDPVHHPGQRGPVRRQGLLLQGLCHAQQLQAQLLLHDVQGEW